MQAHHILSQPIDVKQTAGSTTKIYSPAEVCIELFRYLNIAAYLQKHLMWLHINTDELKLVCFNEEICYL